MTQRSFNFHDSSDNSAANDVTYRSGKKLLELAAGFLRPLIERKNTERKTSSLLHQQKRQQQKLESWSAGSGFENLEERLVLSSVSVLPKDPLANDPIAQLDAAGSSQSTAEVFIQNDAGEISNAANLGPIRGTVRRNDNVSTEPDFYRFRTEGLTDVRIRLEQLNADIELRLYDANKELIKWSLRPGTENEFIRAELSRGWYYIGVSPYDSRIGDPLLGADPELGDYRLTVTGIDLRPDNGGNSLEEATEIGHLNEDLSALSSGWVGTSDQWDYYQYYIESFSKVRLILNRLSGNADLHVYDVDGRKVISSQNSGRQFERISRDFSPGIYTVGIQAITANVYYSFSGIADPTSEDGRLANVGYWGNQVRDINLNAMNAPEAWSSGNTGKDIVVAVIDTGVDYRHQDLSGQMWVNTKEIAGDGIDNDGNGYVDDINGWNFDGDDNKPLDDNGHGTHVAGIIASARNRYGSTGVAFDSKIMAIRVLDNNGEGEFSELAKGIYYAVDNGANVINLSVGGEYNYAVRAAISYANSKGVFVSAATGNGGAELPYYPGRHSASLSNVLSVGAHNRDDVRAWFSNQVGESESIQVDAPGVNVYSTLPDGRYGRYSGTSTSASFVSGLAALVLSVNPKFSPNLVRHFITEGAVRKISNSDSVGGIDAARSIYLAKKYNGDQDGSHFGAADDQSGDGEGKGGLAIQNYDYLASAWNRAQAAIESHRSQAALQSSLASYSVRMSSDSPLLTSVQSASPQSHSVQLLDSLQRFLSQSNFAFDDAEDNEILDQWFERFSTSESDSTLENSGLEDSLVTAMDVQEVVDPFVAEFFDWLQSENSSRLIS